MKKFLSMVLALVMVMSLVTVSAGAKDFTDDEAITYEEAVAVVSEIGVVDGYTDGTFKPANTLTRQAAAKIICNLILGPTTAAELHADTAPYKDVPANGEFAGYIAFCAKKGIISGYKDGTFRPGGTLTGYAFMKMLLGALGYDATLEQYTGPNWSINVAKQAIGIGLDDGIELKDDAVFNGLKAVTREEACLYAFNTLQADLVEYGQRLTTNINGTEVTLSAGGAKSREWNSQQSRYDHIRPDNLIQFAEEYFNKLEKKADTDDFERPAHTWLYDKVKIGTYVDWEKMVERYTSGVTGRDLYDLLTSTTIRDNDLEYYVNGLVPGTDNETATDDDASLDGGDNILKKDLVRSNQKDVGITDDGVLTEVFLDKDKELITIVSVNTWLSKASGDYSESKEYAPLSVFFSLQSDRVAARTWNVDVEDVPSIVDVKEDDFRLVKISYKNNLKGDVVVVTEPDVMEQSTITKFSQSSGSTGDGKVTKLTTGGTEYKAAVKAFYDDEVLDNYDRSLLTDKTYNIFMDEYGYFIGVELYEGTKNYVFITGFDRPTSNLSISTAKANGIFLDGTMELMTVNVTDTDKNIQSARNRHAVNNNDYQDSNAADYFVKWRDMPLAAQGVTGADGSYRYNRWFTYSKNEAGVYTLTPATRMNAQKMVAAETTIKTDNVYVTDNVLKNNTEPYGINCDTATTDYTYHRNWVARSYGNDDSVFITVSLDDVDTSSGARAITDVDEVYTGVDNVEIEIEKEDDAQEAEIYTVYDRSGYIIGCVVIGEGKGSNASIAYVLSDAKSERIENDTYYWEFEAVHEGEIKTLTAKSKYTTIFDTLVTENAKHGERGGVLTSKLNNVTDGIVELRFDADGYVVNVKPVEEKNIYNYYGQRTSTGAADETIKGTNSLGVMMDLADAKVYRMNVLQSNRTDGLRTDSVPNELELASRTLYVTAGRQDEGLVLTSDAKAVVIQDENNKSKVKTEFNSVAAALAHLADFDTTVDGLQYEGEIVAAIDGRGAATWVVFYNYTKLTTGNQGGTGLGQVTGYVSIDNTNWMTVLKDGATPTADECIKLITAELSKKGTLIGNPEYKFRSGDNKPYYEFIVEQDVGGRLVRIPYFWLADGSAAVKGSAMNVDGKPVVISDAKKTEPEDVASELGIDISKSTGAMVRLSNGKTLFVANGATFASAIAAAGYNADKVTVEGVTFGYIKVTVDANVADTNNDAVGFYGNDVTEKNTKVPESVQYVKAGSKVTVNVVLGQKNGADTSGVAKYELTITHTADKDGKTTTKKDLPKNVAAGSNQSLTFTTKKAATDVVISDVDLKSIAVPTAPAPNP